VRSRSRCVWLPFPRRPFGECQTAQPFYQTTTLPTSPFAVSEPTWTVQSVGLTWGMVSQLNFSRSFQVTLSHVSSPPDAVPGDRGAASSASRVGVVEGPATPRHTGSLSPLIKTARDAWARWIGPETLISQVRGTAPFLEPRLPVRELSRLIELGNSPDGFLRILVNWKNILSSNLNPEEQLQDYFALCLACHHATVATFVPTDVDTKIRGILWHESRDPDVLRPMLHLALASRAWTEDGISIRAIRGVSGHNGEQWSAIAGGLGRMLELGDTVSAGEAQAAIESEIDREQAVFEEVAAERNAELDLLRLSMTLAHNRGDLTQGMGFWKRTTATSPVMDLLSKRGRFSLAVRMYQYTGLSAEGHRHYPLRAVKVLRRSSATLLPLCPFLDEWGGIVAQLDESHEVLAALVGGCQKVHGQQGYYRAIAGMRTASSTAFERAAAQMPNGAQRQLRDSELRKLIDVPRLSFESMMRKRARTALAMFRGKV